MKKFVVVIVLVLSFISAVQAGAVQGKNIYFNQLKEACGFTGEVMGKKYTTKEWTTFYKNKTLARTLKDECPRSTLISKKSDLRSLFAFFKLFSKDSGNEASCN